MTRLDKIRNQYLRGSFQSRPNIRKNTESRLQGGTAYTKEMKIINEVKIALILPEEKRSRDRPRLSSWSNIARHMKKAQLSEPTTQDRLSWVVGNM